MDKTTYILMAKAGGDNKEVVEIAGEYDAHMVAIEALKPVPVPTDNTARDASDSGNAWLKSLKQSDDSEENALFESLRKANYLTVIYPAWVAAGKP